MIEFDGQVNAGTVEARPYYLSIWFIDETYQHTIVSEFALTGHVRLNRR